MSLEIDPAVLLPADDSAYGFDNVADVLGVSPVLLERYLSAAGKVSALAVGDPESGVASETFRIRQDASQDRHVEGLPIGTVGGMLAHTTLPLDGEYVIQPRLFRTNLGAMRGLEYPHQIEITVDGARVHLASFGGDDDFKASLKNPTLAGDDVEARARVRLPLTAGPHAIGVAFIEKPAAQNSWRLQPFLRSSHDTFDPTGYPHIDVFSITGPYNPTGPGDTPSRRKVFMCRPATAAEEEPCARRIVSTLARRAYRGQVSEDDLKRLMSFYATGRREGSFERGIQLALQRMLASAKFALRIERDPADAAPGSVYRLSDLELASRLSFFLWSSIPDDELLRVARAGTAAHACRPATAGSPDAGRSEVRSARRQLRRAVALPAQPEEHGAAVDRVRRTSTTTCGGRFERETELFFESIMRENRNVLDLMTADYTFVNERLAKHYGIPGIYGSHFRRVTLTDEARDGLLGKGAILMVTSHTDRTSPVVRGKWVLDNLLGAPPPPMPANVPPLDENAQQAGRVLTMRERMEEHRRNPVCANCHKLMDPIGLAMENFDAVGAWRTREGGTHGTAIDASGVLLDGTKVDGVVSLREALLRQSRDLRRHGRRKAHDLRARPRRRGRRHADGAADRAGRRAPELPVRVDRRGHREQPAVSHAAVPVRPKKSESSSASVAGSSGSSVNRVCRADKGARHVHHEEGTVPSDDSAGHGRDDGAAVPRRDGARLRARRRRPIPYAASARSSCRSASGPASGSRRRSGANFEMTRS